MNLHICNGDFKMEKQYLTLKEVSKTYFSEKISVASLYRLVESGELPAIRIGKKYLIKLETLKEKYG